MADRDDLTAPLIWERYDRLAGTVIWHFKRYSKDSRTSGDDSVLGNVWEEYKDQVQYEAGFFFDVYEDELESLCRRVVERLPEDERKLLWLYSEAFYDWDDEEEPEPPYSVDGVVAELMDRVRQTAGAEPVRGRDDE